MRINIYAEEITTQIEYVTKAVPGTTETLYGIRIYLEPSDNPHHTLSDDDRSAITFWFS